MSLRSYLNCVKAGGVIAYPTETVWGLGGRVEKQVVDKICEIKQRKPESPFSILVKDSSQALEFAEIHKNYLPLLDIYWPGPVTFVLPAKDTSIAELLGATDFIGFRVSSHRFVKEFMSILNEPLITTSANLSSQSPVLKRTDLSWLPGEVEYVGEEYPECGAEKPSTVVKLAGHKLEILRPGPIDSLDIQNLFYEMSQK